jgi:hypothetical protein
VLLSSSPLFVLEIVTTFWFFIFYFLFFIFYFLFFIFYFFYSMPRWPKGIIRGVCWLGTHNPNG